MASSKGGMRLPRLEPSYNMDQVVAQALTVANRFTGSQGGEQTGRRRDASPA
jgi:hypothetical protein